MTFLLMLACQPQAAPPGDLSDPMPWLLGHPDASEAEILPRIERLQDYLLELPLTSGAADRAFAPGELTDEHRDALPHAHPTGPLTALALGWRSAEDIDDHREATAEVDRRCVVAPSWTAWTRTFTDGACFPEGCDDARASDAATLAWAPAAFSLTLQTDYQWFNLADGRSAMLSRSSLPEAAVPTRAGDHLDERYALELWIEDPDDSGATLVAGAIWIGSRFIDPSPLEEVSLPDRLRDELDGAWVRTGAWIDDPGSCAIELD